MNFIDTHAHLDYDYEKPTEELLKFASDQGVKKVITIAAEPESLETTKIISEKFDNVWFSNGIHPHDAKNFNASIKEAIQKNLSHKKAVALGEIGLDYHYNNSQPEVQKSVFKEQMDLLDEVDLPVVIHTRDAEKDTLEILDSTPVQNYRKTPGRERGVIHSFTGTAGFAKECIERDFLIAFNGIITFKKSDELRSIVKQTPLEKIILETDCPFLTPVPHRGKKNQPGYVPLVAQMVAKCHNCSVEEVAEVTTNNAERLFLLNP
jgi:TatD DNase family protein